MQYHCLSMLELYDSKIHVFCQTNQLQGILPDLLSAKSAGRLHIWPIIQMCDQPAPSIACLPDQPLHSLSVDDLIKHLTLLMSFPVRRYH